MGNINIYLLSALVAAILFGLIVVVKGPGPIGTETETQGGPTMSQAEFRERMDYLARDGGRWTAPNPDHVAGDGSPVSFGYLFRWGPNRGYAVVEISGTLEDGSEQLYWEIMTAWDPETHQASHFQAGVGGTIGRGVAFYPDEIREEILIELVNPDGSKFYLRDLSEIVDENSFVSTSYLRFSEDEPWQESQTLHWERVRG